MNKKAVFDFLDELREAGIINQMNAERAAPPLIRRKFPQWSQRDAVELTKEWLRGASQG